MSSPSSPIWSTQPFKTFYTVGYWAVNISHLLFLSVRYAFAPLRAVPKWSYKLSIGAALMRANLRYLAIIRFQQPRQLTPSPNSRDCFVLIRPSPKAVRGNLASPAVQPSPVGAVWSPAPVTSSSTNGIKQKVVVYAPGGAFVLGWDLDENAQSVAAVATEHFGATNVLYMQYRLASRETPFPAAVQDLFVTYQHVLGLGVAPSDIVLMGDSAGANLVLGVLRYLSEERLPQPGGAVTFSPWVDVTPDAVQRYGRSIASRIDLLDVPLLEWGVDAYRPSGKTPLDPKEEAYVSPMNHPFKLETPLFIDSGSLEGLYESISIFARQMTEVEGNRVHFNTSMDLPHDFFMTYPIIGTKEEACRVLEQAKRFLDS